MENESSFYRKCIKSIGKRRLNENNLSSRKISLVLIPYRAQKGEKVWWSESRKVLKRRIVRNDREKVLLSNYAFWHLLREDGIVLPAHLAIICFYGNKKGWVVKTYTFVFYLGDDDEENWDSSQKGEGGEMIRQWFKNF